MNVVQLLRTSVVRNPLHPCLKFKFDGTYREWTYQEVWNEIVKFAASLKERGIVPGDKVAIMADSSEKWMICDFAIMALGAVVVPIYPSVTPEQAAYILKNADVKCLIAGTWELMEGLDDLLPESVQFAVLLSGSILPYSVPVESFDEIRAQALPPFDEQTLDNIRGDDLATIVHTSGTSGTPKGVMLSHRNLTSNVEACLGVLTVERNDVALSYLPLSHIFERTVGHFCILTAGGTIAYAESLETIQEDVRQVGPTVLVTVPRLLEKVYAGILQKVEEKPRLVSGFILGCLKAPVGSWKHGIADKVVYEKLRTGLGGNLRAVVSGGAGLSDQISMFYGRAGIPVCEGYGMTETAPVITVNPLEDIRPGSVGRPLPNVEVKIAPDGELLVKGPNVMQGYYGNPEASAEVIDSDGWLHTGDVAEFEDGYIRIVERKKNLLVLATGKNVAPYPIENAMTLSPMILDTVLVGDGRKYVTCLLVPDFEAIQAKLQIAASEDEIDYDSMVSNLEVRRLLQREIQQSVSQFAEFERPKRAVLLTAPFSIESGDLTPTLKVKAKVVLQKYRDKIEDMYNGLNYLDIYGTAQTGLPSTVPSTVSSASHETDARQEQTGDSQKHRKPHRANRKWLWFVSAAVLILALVGLLLPKQISPNLNLLAMLHKVHHNNDQINRSNNQIVNKMAKVEHLSSLSPQLASQLQTLSGGLNQQNTNLSTLKQLSQDEIGLSQQFANLAKNMSGNLSDVSKTTSSQAKAAAKMSKVAAQVSQTAKQLQQTNQEIASKLHQANAQTQLVSSEVP